MRLTACNAATRSLRSRDYYGSERYAALILQASGLSSDYQTLSRLQVGTQLTLPDVSGTDESVLNGKLSEGGDVIHDYRVNADEMAARAQMLQAAADTQTQQAGLAAFNDQADRAVDAICVERKRSCDWCCRHGR
jgi:hypothetical protein